MDDMDKFTNAIRQRSDENNKALSWLMEEKLYSLVGSIIRMELDSLIRICYIKSISNEERRRMLFIQFFNGQRWKFEKDIVTDRNMVSFIANNLGLRWAEPIYDIGCAFIHLSPYHDYMNLSPTSSLTNEQRKIIINHVKDHHKIELEKDFSFIDLVGVAPLVYKKLRDNLLYYI